MHQSTYEYLQPTDDQKRAMEVMRRASADFSATVAAHVPDGPDKTYLLRKHREVAMWANVAITRHADGSPRTEIAPASKEPDANFYKD